MEPPPKNSALFRCLEVLVCLADRLPYDFQFGTQHLRCFLWVSSDANANWHGVLHGVLCRHTDDLVDFSTKLWIPRESDAVSLPWSPRRARRCRRHHPLGLLSIPAGLASECEKKSSISKQGETLLEQIRGKRKNRSSWGWMSNRLWWYQHAQHRTEELRCHGKRPVLVMIGVTLQASGRLTGPRRREFLRRSSGPLDWSQKTVGCSRSPCASAS